MTRLALCFLLLVGCGGPVYDSNAPTLWVENAAGLPVGVYLRGARIATVDAGQSRCIRLRGSLDNVGQLGFKMPAHPILVAPAESLASSSGWSIRLSINPSVFDMLTLQPARACD